MTEMQAIPAAPPVDEITVLLGHISEPEYQIRARLRDCRTLAAFRASRSTGPTSRALWSDAADWAGDYLFAACDMETLEGVAELCRSLAVAAVKAEKLEAPHGLE